MSELLSSELSDRDDGGEGDGEFRLSVPLGSVPLTLMVSVGRVWVFLRRCVFLISFVVCLRRPWTYACTQQMNSPRVGLITKLWVPEEDRRLRYPFPYQTSGE